MVFCFGVDGWHGTDIYRRTEKLEHVVWPPRGVPHNNLIKSEDTDIS